MLVGRRTISPAVGSRGARIARGMAVIGATMLDRPLGMYMSGGSGRRCAARERGNGRTDAANCVDGARREPGKLALRHGDPSKLIADANGPLCVPRHIVLRCSTTSSGIALHEIAGQSGTFRGGRTPRHLVHYR